MGPRKYPLEPLVRLRKDRAETRTRELAAAIATREGAERRRQRAEQERDAERARADAVRQEERASLERGQLSVLELARVGAWEQRVSGEDAERARGVTAARAAEREAKGGEVDAQSRVSVARAEVEATARHERRWTLARDKQQEAQEEEALVEAAPPKRAR